MSAKLQRFLTCPCLNECLSASFYEVCVRVRETFFQKKIRLIWCLAHVHLIKARGLLIWAWRAPSAFPYCGRLS